MRRASALRVILLLLAATATTRPTRAGDETDGPRSQPVSAVIREPLPPEDLSCSERDGRIVVAGPTFEYDVDGTTGALAALQARREGRSVVRLVEPARLVVGTFDSAGKGNTGETVVTSRSAEKVVLTTRGTLRSSANPGDELPYTLESTFFNDGVVVCAYTLLPRKDATVEEVRHEVRAVGAFRHYLHKTRDEHGIDSPWAALPDAGGSATFSTLTSCLQVFSPKAGLAIFTDRGAVQASAGLDTAVVKVTGREGDEATVSLTQYIVHDQPGDSAFRLRANEPFRVRVGLSVVPNRLPHRRRHDLRMFGWIGDDRNPYPTDKEILDAAKLGYTMFQMHRLGTPGEPRPPAAELDRVLKTVHDAGMLFIWTANADLMYASAPGVRKMQAEGKWPLWQGFNYEGRYSPPMDRYCDLLATCLASPNGLGDYRIACDAAMLDRYDVDGMYIDDNLAYPNCPLWKEHGHPQKVYDSLIELHEMNWRRRQLLRARRPHAVLIDHCSKATVLPAICDFDAHLYGEGYSFSSPESYWAQFGAIKNMDAQGCLWAGDDESERCAAELAYNYDLLTGGGQYMYLDWRLYPEKFPYAAGVSKDEPLFVRAYNLAQYGFGMYESTPYYFSESARLFGTDVPGSYATIYRNETWGDCLVVLANMNDDAGPVHLSFRAPERLGLQPGGRYALLNAIDGKCLEIEGEALIKQGIDAARVPAKGLRLFSLRRLPDDGPRHLWGGKRLSERWNAEAGKLNVELQGPPGAEEVVAFALGAGAGTVGNVRVDGEPGRFLLDAPQRVVHGKVRFGKAPVRIEVSLSRDDQGKLPEGPIPRPELPTR